MGDQLIRIPRVDFEGRTQPYDTLDGLRSLVGRHPNLQGVVRAREALDLMRVGRRLRARIAAAAWRWPMPAFLNRTFNWHCGTLTPCPRRADLGYRHRRLAIQYDGGHHLLDAQSLSDRRRDKAFESAGWTVLIFDKDDLADGFQRAVGKIKRMLRTAWLDHPQASGFADAG